MRRIFLAFAIVAFTLLTSAGVAGASSSKPLGDGTFDLTYCPLTTGCASAIWDLGANHIMSDNLGGTGTWKYNATSHKLTVTYPAFDTVYTGKGTPKKGFSGTITEAGKPAGTFTASEPPGA